MPTPQTGTTFNDRNGNSGDVFACVRTISGVSRNLADLQRSAYVLRAWDGSRPQRTTEFARDDRFAQQFKRKPSEGTRERARAISGRHTHTSHIPQRVNLPSPMRTHIIQMTQTSPSAHGSGGQAASLTSRDA